jgi:hypothetical protein
MTDCPAFSDDPMTVEQESEQLKLWKQMNCPLILSVDISQLSSAEIALLRAQ